MLRKLLPLVAAFSLAMAPAVSFAAGGPSDDKKSESPAEKAKKALEKVSDFEFDGALAAAVTKLRDDTKLNFVLDTQTLINFVGIDPNTLAVKVNDKNTKLKTSLRSMLSPFHLSYAIVGDAVIITTEDMAMQRQMKQRVSVDLDAVPFSDAIKQLARETATNVIVDGKVKKDAEAALTLQLEDVPLETAIRLMSEAAGLKPVRMGNVLYITSKANATEMRNDPDLITGQPTGPGGPAYPPPPTSYGPVGIPGGVVPNPPLPPPDKELPPPKEGQKEDK
jgi:hypothetical protein